MTGNMRHTLLPSIVITLFAVVTLHGEPPPLPAPHVRIADPALRQLFDAGCLASPTLRALVSRLDSSDVIAYIRFEGPRGGIDGSLQFVSASAGIRYVLIRVVRLPARSRQLALIAHELQHAVEVAAAPHIVDQQTFVQEYERIGDTSHHRRRRERSFETLAARATGKRVLEELNGRDLRRQRRPHAEVASLTTMAPEVPSDD
jgi:hypothetical protein